MDLECLFFFLFLSVIVESKPNVIILFADDLGYGDLSVNGNPSTVTPNLQRLKESGLTFTQWYSGAAVCSPSRAAMVTGRLAVRSGCAGPNERGGVFANDAVSGLPANETTFATLLSEQGYQTKMIGKWHLGVHEGFFPTNHGFDEYIGIPFSVDMGSSPWENNSETPLPLIRTKKNVKNITFVEQPADLTTLSEVYAHEAVTFIEEQSKGDDPFLLYFAFNHVHVPNFISPKFCNKTIRGQFGDALMEMDDVIGQVLDAVKKSKVEEDTLIFFTSDNGPWLPYREQGGNAGPFRGGKFSCWEGGFREPALVSWPGTIKPGTITQAIATTMDIFATIVPLSGAKIPNDRIIDGKNLYPIFQGEHGNSSSGHDTIFYYGGTPNSCAPQDKNMTCPGLWAIRYKSYKMHWVSADDDHPKLQHYDPPLLFNIEQDISEKWPIHSTEDEYQKLLKIFTQIKFKHENELINVENQIAKGGSIKYRLCCDPNSKDKFPDYPTCTCQVENWNQILCIRKLIPSLASSKPEL